VAAGKKRLPDMLLPTKIGTQLAVMMTLGRAGLEAKFAATPVELCFVAVASGSR
jgi:hypothetical protein